MKVREVKEELYEMRRLARKAKERLPRTLYNDGYSAGYHKAISEILRIINQREYLETPEDRRL